MLADGSLHIDARTIDRNCPAFVLASPPAPRPPPSTVRSTVSSGSAPTRDRDTATHFNPYQAHRVVFTRCPPAAPSPVLGTGCGCSSAGCSPATPPAKTEVIRPALVVPVRDAGANSFQELVGEIRAAQRAELLAFAVGGRVQSVLVEPGDTVQRGQVLAQLDEQPLRAQRATAAGEVARRRRRQASWPCAPNGYARPTRRAPRAPAEPNCRAGRAGRCRGRAEGRPGAGEQRTVVSAARPSCARRSAAWWACGTWRPANRWAWCTRLNIDGTGANWCSPHPGLPLKVGKP